MRWQGGMGGHRGVRREDVQKILLQRSMCRQKHATLRPLPDAISRGILLGCSLCKH